MVKPIMVQEKEDRIRIVVVGDERVGKTSVLRILMGKKVGKGRGEPTIALDI